MPSSSQKGGTIGSTGAAGAAMGGKPETSFWDNVNPEQQLVLVSMLAGIIGLAVAMGMVSGQTDIWDNALRGTALILALVFGSLVACSESGLFALNQLPSIEATAAVVSSVTGIIVWIYFGGTSGLWVLGLVNLFQSCFHSWHILMMHRRGGKVPSYWSFTRGLLLFLPFLVLWIAVPVSMTGGPAGDNSDHTDSELLLAAHGSFVVSSVGAIVPTLLHLSPNGYPLKNLYPHQEKTRLLWVTLNVATLFMLCWYGGVEWMSPVALSLPAAVYFGATAWDQLPEMSLATLASPQAVKAAMKHSLPHGLASVVLAVLCLAVTVASRALGSAGSPEPSAAVGPFLSLLVGAGTHFANDSADLHLARLGISACFLVSSFWTGRYTSILSQAFAAIVWSVLQVAHVMRKEVTKDGAAKELNPWFEDSLSPRLYFAGAVLCMGSFAATDWIDRWDGTGPTFLAARAVLSITFLPLLSAVANAKRAELDADADAGNVCLVAMALPLVAAFCSSGPWYDNTAGLGFVYSMFALVYMRLINAPEFWESRNIKMERASIDRTVYALFFVLFASTTSHTFFPHQNWVITLLGFFSAGVDGVALTDATNRLAMLRPPIVGGLILFIFSTVTEKQSGSCTDTACAFVPLLLLIPVAFIFAGLGGRVSVGVLLNDLRVDLAMACAALSLCAAPFAMFLVGGAVEYDDDKGSRLPSSAWTLMAVLIAAQTGGAVLVYVASQRPADLEAGKQTKPRSASEFEIRNPMALRADEDLDVRDVLVSGAAALTGCASVEMPVALLVGTVLGMYWARRQRSLHAAVLASFVFLSRVLVQVFDELYGLPSNIWLLIGGVVLLLLVSLWPMPKLVSSGDSTEMGAGSIGAVAAVLQFCFSTAGVMMVGPATQGWASLAGTLFITLALVSSSPSGALRAAVATPVLYFGSLALVIQRFSPEDYVGIAACVTGLFSLVGGVALRCAAKTSSDEAVAHFLVFCVFLPFGLVAGGVSHGVSPIASTAVVAAWGYAHVKKSALASAFLVSAIPVTLLGSVAALLLNSSAYSKEEQRGFLAFALALYGVKLAVVGRFLLPAEATTQSLLEQPAAAPSETAKGFTFSKAMVGFMAFLDSLGAGCRATFVPAGLLWLLASLVFVDGYAALAFALAVTSLLAGKMLFHGVGWGYVVPPVMLAVTTVAAIVDVGSGIIWPKFGSAAVVSIVTLPLPFIIKALAVNDKAKAGLQNFASFVAVVVTIPYGFAGAVATRGVLAPVSVVSVALWCSWHPSMHAMGAAVIPNLALIAGVVLNHGGNGPDLVTGTFSSVLPGLTLVACGIFFAVAGHLDNKRKAVQKAALAAGALPEGMQAWVVPDFLRRSGGVAIILGLAFGCAGLVGVVAVAMLVLFAGLAPMVSEKDVSKDKVAELVVYTVFILTAVCCTVYEDDFTGVASGVTAAVVAVSVAGFFLSSLALVLDRSRSVVPEPLLDFLIYLWFVLGGLIGAAATDGALGIVVVVLGAGWAFHRRHSLVLCAVLPLLMFWAGASLDAATHHDKSCISVGVPVLVYGLCELFAAGAMRSSGVGGEDTPKGLDVKLKGPGSVPSWANPEGIVPFLLSSCLEVSGAAFIVAGAFAGLYCPDKTADGDPGMAGDLGFCGTLLVLGIYLILRGLYYRDAEAGKGDPSPAHQKDAAALSFRFRLAGLTFLNAAVWFALPMAKSVAAKSGIIVAGSVLLILSGCTSMYWRKNLLGVFDGTAPNKELPKVPNVGPSVEEGTGL